MIGVSNYAGSLRYGEVVVVFRPGGAYPQPFNLHARIVHISRLHRRIYRKFFPLVGNVFCCETIASGSGEVSGNISALKASERTKT